jgi:alpha-beta hydrolase superfamily lysophospholipase
MAWMQLRGLVGDRRQGLRVGRGFGAVAAMWVGACTFTPPPAGAFYSPPRDTLARAAGELVRHEPIPGAPVGAQAYRVLYTSTGLHDETIVVSGIIVVPFGPAPTRGWDVVAWAHPTTGVASVCAPSLRDNPLSNILGLEALLQRGYVVTATDYPGLGAPGTHPYLVGVSEGRAVLDLIRAARKLPGEQIGPRFAVWGHSQGGQAALFTGEISTSYAPELALVGVGAAAPATDLAVLLDDDINSVAGRVLVSYALWSWSRVYDAPMDSLVTKQAIPIVNDVAGECVETIGELYHAAVDVVPLRKNFLHADPDSVPPWNAFLERNRAGQRRTGAPFFIAQGTDDQIVRPGVTVAFAAHLCALDERVRFVELKGAGHLGAGEESAGAMVAWMEDRFAGNPAPNDCEALAKRAAPSR